MASSALEEKINKIRQQNEEIRRRYEEVEADKKNAAKLNALVQLVPSDDWPERREPPEFSAPPKTIQKQKSITKDRENERPTQHYTGIQERLAKKDHKFAEGEGPPPDPKYNFLADSERETRAGEKRTDEDKNKAKNRTPRGGAGPRRRGGGNLGGGGSRDAFFKDNRGPHAFHSREESLPEYEAWRAERNRIDEARINRQKTAEGNWRREWDCNKVSLEKDQPRRDFARKDSNSFDRRNNHYDNDYSSRGHGGSRTYHQSQKNYSQDYRHPHHEQPHEFKRQQSDCKTPFSPVDNRTVAAVDQSIKVTVNQGSQANKATVMSVKVNSPSIAGTGRVGPRQKSRITYSSQSDSNTMAPELNSFMRQKSFDEKTAAANFNNGPKLAPKSPFAQRKKEGNPKSPHISKKEFKIDEYLYPKSRSKASHSQRNESRDQRQSINYFLIPPRIQKRKVESNKIGHVSVVEDSVPVENDINKPIDNEFHIQNNESTECAINKIDDTAFSDLSNNFDYSVVGHKETTDATEENVSFDNEENVVYDSNIVNEENVNYENADDVINDQFADAVEESNKTIETDNSVKSDQKPDSAQNNETFNVYSYLVDGSLEDEINHYSANSVQEAFTDHQDIVKTSSETISAAESKPAILDAVEVKVDLNEPKEAAQALDETTLAANLNPTVIEATEDCTASVKEEANEKTQPSDNETKEIPQMPDESKNEKSQLLDKKTEEITHTPDESKNGKVDIDLKLEQEENVTEEQCEEKITCKQEEAGDIKNEESQQSNAVELKVNDPKVEDNSANDLIEPEENVPADDSLQKGSDDSGFLDNTESDALNKTSTTETNDSAILSDCHTVEDFDNSLNKSGAEHDVDEISPETAKSDIVNITKGDCKEALDICDNVSTAASVTQMNEDKEKANEILENSIKDNDAKVIENDHHNSEVLKVISMQEENVNTAEKKVEQVSEESNGTKSEESNQE